MANPLPDNTQHETVSAWFLGPKAENVDNLIKAFTTIVSTHKTTRLNYYDHDKAWITEGIKSSPAFDAASKNVQKELEGLIKLLSEHSVPWFSPRYNAHMAGENSIPGIVGYLAAMLGFNQNNVTFEVSPVTTVLEIEAGRDICKMAGYPAPAAWGHITCDGSVANLESMWASRNLKFYPLSLRDAMEPGAPLDFIAPTFMIKPCKGNERLMSELDTWELLNLQVDTILNIPERLQKEYLISSTFLDEALKPYIIQTVGKSFLEAKWGIKSPQLFCTRTKHYSWPKAAAITGIGSQNAVDVDVGIDACMNIDTLERLLRGNSAEKRAVYTVVAVIGTTEEGAVDDLVAISNLRQKLQQELGLSFVIHADAAWGGYFASTIPKATQGQPQLPPSSSPYVPGVALCPRTITQLTNLHLSDSLTTDPHKTAYTPYPAGALCYRDGRMKNLLTWQAPYLHEGSVSIGTFGVEGSKPGASASSVWLTHKVMPLHEKGLGALLREVSFTSRRFAAHWSAMTDDPHAQPDPNDPDKELIVVPFNLLPVEWEDKHTTEQIQIQKKFIRDNILHKENEELSEEAMKILVQLGSNMNVNTFVCNFRINGKVNTDVDEANYLNRRIYERLSITEPGEDPNSIPLYLSSTLFRQDEYRDCATKFKERLGLKGKQDLFVLRSTVMSPFAASSNFVSKLADAFKEVLRDEVKTTLKRNGTTPDFHEFVVQGSGKSKYLVYQPMFNKLNSCYQVILNVEIDPQPTDNLPVILKNKKEATLKDLCSNDFAGTISVGFKEVRDVQVKIVGRVKQGSLNFDNRTTYPKLFMPFYLYGDDQECHLTHLISADPNIQLCASNVTLKLNLPLSATDLKTGVIVYAHGIHEASMEPFDANKDLPEKLPFFHAGKALTVTVYADPYAPNLDEIIQLPGPQGKEIAKGNITLGTRIFVENDRINEDPWKLTRTLSGKMKNKTKESWEAIVRAA